MMNARSGRIIRHYIKCYNTIVGKTLIMYHEPPRNHSLFVAKKGGIVLPSKAMA